MVFFLLIYEQFFTHIYVLSVFLQKVILHTNQPRAAHTRTYTVFTQRRPHKRANLHTQTHGARLSFCQ